MTTLKDWEVLEPLGEGGQSEVFKVRTPDRVRERDSLRKTLVQQFGKLYPLGTVSPDTAGGFAELVYAYARPEEPSELAALKRFKIPQNSQEAQEAFGRLRNEIAVLRAGGSGLVKLLDANEAERWIVTEFMPNGTLESHPTKYKGNAHGALKAFRSLVETVASLHKEKIVHRDIKPANVFLGANDKLVLGDFGIVFLPDQPERLTTTNERVGPRDYMPQWGDLGQRLEGVQPNFDVYMLGKLLWCMVSGRLKLPREYHKLPAYDVTVLFPNDTNMWMVSEILERCVVEYPEKCLKSAQELLPIVHESLALLERGVPMLDQNGRLARPCRMCGKGVYRELYPQGSFRLSSLADNRPTGEILLRVFICSVCTHYELFAPNYPDEAAKRGWKPEGR